MAECTGHAWIVGAGPGDPGLLTVAAARALAGADLVLYDALVNPAILACARAGAELAFVGKRAGDHAMPQGEIEARMTRAALSGARVVRLKGGDPFVFGRGGEEALACREAGVPFTVIPGITSAIAGPAYAGIPVTHRGTSSSFMVITATGAEDERVDWQAAARAGTLVVLMGAAKLGESMEALIGHGADRDTPAAAVQWASRANQRSVLGTAGTIAGLVEGAGMDAPLVLVVGEVVRLGERLAWFQEGPLAGKRIVVTRARAQASTLVERLAALGASVIEAPVIATALLPGESGLRAALDETWEWIVFTSANAVDATFAALAERDRDARALAGTGLAVIGDGTAAALVRHGLRADFIAPEATAERLAESLPGAQRARILIPQSALSDGSLAAALRQRGAAVTQMVAYETVARPLDEGLRRDVLSADAVTFASSSAATNLRLALGKGAFFKGTTQLVSIGPKTSEAVRERFGRVDREAESPGLDELVTATVEALTWDS